MIKDGESFKKNQKSTLVVFLCVKNVNFPLLELFVVTPGK